ncbi:hypothetical protein JTE90_025988 [Oedothorax gibbosus]|uniref:Uncharacterized protein n=1 Tax=Oedothorax gibbosus TaxID=931172 RepID=A0AAV6TSQ2_9ARAC|nr:hypothetical protein JTE90_025988 [Oedothorax gibbosus]
MVLRVVRNLTCTLLVGSITIEEKTTCLKDPMCYWNYFDEKCYCHRNPCDTLYCYPDMDKSDEVCICSMLLCQWNDTREGCGIPRDDSRGEWCVCNASFSYPLFNFPPVSKRCINSSCGTLEPEDFTPDVKAAIKSLNLDPKIEDLLTKLKLSHTSDVRDAEKYFHPTIRVVDDYGIPYDSMILSCSYGPEPCSDMVTLYSPDYGKCYMFNYVGIHNSKDTPVKKARQAGRHHGLQLYMQSRKQDTIPLLTRELGVRIVVHDPRSIPLASENGIDIRPGDMVSVNVEYTEIHRLGEPWGQCVKDGDVLPNNYSTVPYHRRYVSDSH